MKVLVAPLDWGLGHATRCVPVIKEFLMQGAEVEIAVVKANASLFREIFPDVRQRIAPSYNIVYPKHGYNMGLWLVKNSVHLKNVMRFEHRFAEEMVERHGYDILFSDNRFAFYSKNAYNVYMTHQRRIAFPPAFSAFEKVGMMWHASVMKHFDEVWVPDVEAFPGYAGCMSHVSDCPRPVKFVGALSRFAPENGLAMVPKNIDVLAVVSGVEPARSQFAASLREILLHLPGHHKVVLGNPCDNVRSWTEGNVEFHDHLPTAEFADAVRHARLVVSRGGYSTVMDMAMLGAKCVFVPTPGQYEQSVLARDLSKSHYALEIAPERLSVESLKAAFDADVNLPPPPPQNLLRTAVVSLKEKIKG